MRYLPRVLRTPARPAKIGVQSAKFSLTMKEKKAVVGRAFGPYTPAKATKTLKQAATEIRHHPQQTKQEPRRFFARQISDSGRTLTAQEDIKKFAEGFIGVAREHELHMKPGYNPSIVHSEREAAKKLVKEAAAAYQKEHPVQPPPVSESRLEFIRQSLGIQHAPIRSHQPSAALTANLMEPEKLPGTGTPTGWTRQPSAPGMPTGPAAPAPRLSPASGGFVGGNITLPSQHRDETDATTAVPPVIRGHEPTLVPLNAPDQAALAPIKVLGESNVAEPTPPTVPSGPATTESAPLPPEPINSPDSAPTNSQTEP